MKINKIFLYSLMAAGILSACQKTELYDVNEPAWIQGKIDSIAAAKAANQGGEVIDFLEDVYTVGATDYSSGWWTQWSKYYQIPAGQKLVVQFNLNINPEAPNSYKNFAMMITNDVDRGGDGQKEYGAIRFDNQPSGNSEWGDYIDRSLVNSTLTFDTDTDKGIEKLGGIVTVTIDRTDGFSVTMTNGTVTKTYVQKSDVENLNADASNTNIRVFFVPEGSYIDFIGTTIEPIGGCTSKEDKQPLSMELAGIPTEVLLGTPIEEAIANVVGTVQFEQGVSKAVAAGDLQFETIPDFNTVGTKTMIVIYNKTFKGENCGNPIILTKTFNVVNELSAFTETFVVPSPLILGAEDNSSAWWTMHTENIKIEPKETKVVNFTNYSNCENNWNNFVLVLNGQDVAKEYAVLRADNYGWGDGYAACTPVGGQSSDEAWAAWRTAMNGAKVTTYITNNGDGTANVKSVIYGTDGNTYVQEYNGINTIDPDNLYFRFSLDGCHLVFDNSLGADDNTSGWWSIHSTNVKVDSHQICTVNFTNYGSGENNWNNFVLVLNGEDVTKEYAILRADNYGWGDGYAACTPVGGQADDAGWAAWRTAMNGAKVKLTIANNGDGTADIKAVINGSDGNTYTQEYNGINTIDPDNLYFRFTVDSSHLVFE